MRYTDIINESINVRAPELKLKEALVEYFFRLYEINLKDFINKPMPKVLNELRPLFYQIIEPIMVEEWKKSHHMDRNYPELRIEVLSDNSMGSTTADVNVKYYPKQGKLKALIDLIEFRFQINENWIVMILNSSTQQYADDNIKKYSGILTAAVIHEIIHMIQFIRGSANDTKRKYKYSPKDAHIITSREKYLSDIREIESYSYQAAREIIDLFGADAVKILKSRESIEKNLNSLHSLKMYWDEILHSRMTNRLELWQKFLKSTIDWVHKLQA